jgi:hypothetical protein
VYTITTRRTDSARSVTPRLADIQRCVRRNRGDKRQDSSNALARDESPAAVTVRLIRNANGSAVGTVAST